MSPDVSNENIIFDFSSLLTSKTIFSSLMSKRLMCNHTSIITFYFNIPVDTLTLLHYITYYIIT